MSILYLIRRLCLPSYTDRVVHELVNALHTRRTVGHGGGQNLRIVVICG